MTEMLAERLEKIKRDGLFFLVSYLLLRKKDRVFPVWQEIVQIFGTLKEKGRS